MLLLRNIICTQRAAQYGSTVKWYLQSLQSSLYHLLLLTTSYAVSIDFFLHTVSHLSNFSRLVQSSRKSQSPPSPAPSPALLFFIQLLSTTQTLFKCLPERLPQKRTPRLKKPLSARFYFSPMFTSTASESPPTAQKRDHLSRAAFGYTYTAIDYNEDNTEQIQVNRFRSRIYYIHDGSPIRSKLRSSTKRSHVSGTVLVAQTLMNCALVHIATVAKSMITLPVGLFSLSCTSVFCQLSSPPSRSPPPQKTKLTCQWNVTTFD